MKATQAQLLVVLAVTLVLGGLAIMYFRVSTPPLANAPAPAPAPGTPSNPPGSGGGGGCVVGGCSSQLCTDASEGPAISDCLYKPEYACYRSAKCERQTNGSCGWTPSPALSACLQNPPAIQ